MRNLYVVIIYPQILMTEKTLVRKKKKSTLLTEFLKCLNNKGTILTLGHVYKYKKISRANAHKKYFKKSEEPSTLDRYMKTLEKLGVIKKESKGKYREIYYYFTEDGKIIIEKLKEIKDKLNEISDETKVTTLKVKRKGGNRDLSKFI